MPRSSRNPSSSSSPPPPTLPSRPARGDEPMSNSGANSNADSSAQQRPTSSRTSQLLAMRHGTDAQTQTSTSTPPAMSPPTDTSQRSSSQRSNSQRSSQRLSQRGSQQLQQQPMTRSIRPPSGPPPEPLLNNINAPNIPPGNPTPSALPSPTQATGSQRGSQRNSQRNSQRLSQPNSSNVKSNPQEPNGQPRHISHHHNRASGGTHHDRHSRHGHSIRALSVRSRSRRRIKGREQTLVQRVGLENAIKMGSGNSCSCFYVLLALFCVVLALMTLSVMVIFVGEFEDVYSELPFDTAGVWDDSVWQGRTESRLSCEDIAQTGSEGATAINNDVLVRQPSTALSAYVYIAIGIFLFYVWIIDVLSAIERSTQKAKIRAEERRILREQSQLRSSAANANASAGAGGGVGDRRSRTSRGPRSSARTHASNPSLNATNNGTANVSPRVVSIADLERASNRSLGNPSYGNIFREVDLREDRDDVDDDSLTLMQRQPIWNLCFAVNFAFLGVTGFIFHASLTVLAYRLDAWAWWVLDVTFVVYAMAKFLSSGISSEQNLCCCLGICGVACRVQCDPKARRRTAFVSTWLLIFAAAGINALTFTYLELASVEGFPEFMFILLLAVFLFFIWAHWYTRGNEVAYKWSFLVAAGTLGGLGLLFLELDGVICDPMSWGQPHAAWHVASAFVAFSVYLFLRADSLKTTVRSPANDDEEDEEEGEEEVDGGDRRRSQRVIPQRNSRPMRGIDVDDGDDGDAANVNADAHTPASVPIPPNRVSTTSGNRENRNRSSRGINPRSSQRPLPRDGVPADGAEEKAEEELEVATGVDMDEDVESSQPPNENLPVQAYVSSPPVSASRASATSGPGGTARRTNSQRSLQSNFSGNANTNSNANANANANANGSQNLNQSQNQSPNQNRRSRPRSTGQQSGSGTGAGGSQTSGNRPQAVSSRIEALRQQQQQLKDQQRAIQSRLSQNGGKADPDGENNDGDEDDDAGSVSSVPLDGTELEDPGTPWRCEACNFGGNHSTWSICNRCGVSRYGQEGDVPVALPV